MDKKQNKNDEVIKEILLYPGFTFVSPGDLAAKRKRHEGGGGAMEVVLSFFAKDCSVNEKDVVEEINL